MIETKKIKKILILRYRFIGDTVLTTPFIKNLKDVFPLAVVDILVSPNSGEVMEGNPNLNKIFYLDTTKFHKYESTKQKSKHTFTSIFSCAQSLRKENYDLIFVLKRSFSSAFLSFLIGAKQRVGFDTDFRGFLLTNKIKYEKDEHESENYLKCLKLFSNDLKKYSPEIFTNEEEKKKAETLIEGLDPYKPKILIHATSAHPLKTWTRRYFAELIDNLFERYKAQFVFTGADIDFNTYEEILSKSRYKSKINYKNLCGKTSIRECFAVYEKLHLAICVDSGNAHLSSAVNIPTYVIYGPTRPEKWLPLGKNVFPIKLMQNLPCQPCDVKVKCLHKSCMKLITPEMVLNKVSSSFA